MCVVDSDWMLICGVGCEVVTCPDGLAPKVWNWKSFVHIPNARHKAGIHSHGPANQARVETAKIDPCFHLF